MAKMKVSIITVTYNNAATLADTIESVYQQTYQDIEYWIIDGASNDSTLDIIHENVERFQGRLHFTSDNIIEEVVKTFSKKDVDVVYGDIHFIHADRPDKTVRYYSSALFRPFWLRFGFMPAHPSLYVRREVYQEVGPYSLDFTIASDFDMMIRIFRLRKSRYAYLRKDFVTMRTGGISTRNFHNRLVITKEQAAACRKNGIYTNQLLISLKYLRKLLELRI